MTAEDPLRQRTFTAPDPRAILNGVRRIISERTRWDEPPAIGMLYLAGPDSVELRELPVPKEKWAESGDPKNLLRGLHKLLAKPVGLGMVQASDAMRLLLPDAFCGMFMRTEGWAPPEHRTDEVHRARLAGNRGPRFKDMAGRREMRIGTAVDCEGRIYMAVQQRGAPEMEAAYSGKGSGDQVEGAIPDLLWGLVRTLMAPLVSGVPDTIPAAFLSDKKGPNP